MTRHQCVAELDAYLTKVRHAAMPRDFIAGVAAARRVLVKENVEHWHGTINGYNHHGCRCDKCREAVRERAARNRKLGPRKPPPKHVGKRRCSQCRSWFKVEEMKPVEVAGKPRLFCSDEHEAEFRLARGETHGQGQGQEGRAA